MKQTILLFSGLVTAILILLQLGRYSVISGDIRTEIFLGITATVFLGIGLLLRRRKEAGSASTTMPIESTANIDLLATLKEHHITEREYEVLRHIASGSSNREIGEQLFLSESTIKTHVSSLLSKLGARRRTQAVEHARRVGLLE